MWFVRSWGEDVVCQELGEDVVWSEGEGRTVEDGGNEQFGVGSFPRVYICCIPDLCVIVLQQLLLSGNWYCVVCDVGVVARDCFGQVICSLVPFRVAYAYIVRDLKRYAFSDDSEQSGCFLYCSRPTGEGTTE